jgi:hypothetical protein
MNGRFPGEGTNPEYPRTAVADYQTFTKFKVKKFTDGGDSRIC